MFRLCLLSASLREVKACPAKHGPAAVAVSAVVGCAIARQMVGRTPVHRRQAVGEVVSAV